MRCTQFMGLSDEAVQFIEDNVQISDLVTCPTCLHVTGGEPVKRVYDTKTGRAAGMFEDGPNLHEYTLKTGEVVREIIQCVPWSSGPMIYLCLRDEKGLWFGKWVQADLDE